VLAGDDPVGVVLLDKPFSEAELLAAVEGT
jgi:hypothetical protein